MKIRHLGIVIAVALVLGGVWFGRQAWRARQKLVTLHVRNAPLADVVRSMESQTWEKIRVDDHLKARITLNVENAPLSQALDLVAAKAGARWGRTFAVYSSAAALTGLESVLRGDAKLEASGWTNLAPAVKPFEIPAMPPMAGGDEKIRTAMGPLVFKDNGTTRMITFGADGSTNQWSSERLVLESALRPNLSSPPPAEATAESAAQVAAAVHGRSSLYYTLDPGGAAVMGSFGGSRMVRKTISPGGKRDLADIGAALTEQRRSMRLRELGNSPEEQVEHARQAPRGRMQIRTQDVDVPPTNTQP